MDITKWNLEDAKVVWREEALEEGIEKGIEKGRKERDMEIARNMLATGSTLEFVQQITELDMETVIQPAGSTNKK